MKKNLPKPILVVALLTVAFHAKADWTIVNNGLTDKTSNDITVCGTILIDATETGIFTSANSGGTWTLVSGTAYAKSLAVSGTTIYAAIQDGVIGIAKSTDNGATWTSVNTGLPYKYNDAVAVDGSNIFANDFGSTYVSSNQGANWTAVSTLPGFSSIIRSGSMLYAAYSTGGNGYNGIYTSSDNGATWTQPANTGLTQKVHQLAVIGNTLFASTNTGVFTSTDNGASWTAHTAVVGNSIAFAVYGTNLFIGTPGGTFLSSDLGLTYTNVSGIMGTESDVCLTIMGNTIFAGTAYNSNGVYKRDLSEMVTLNSVNSVAHASQLNVYPNPATSTVNIKLSGMRNDSEIRITDMLGNEVKDADLKMQNGSAQLNVSNLSNGVYFVNLKTNEGTLTKKIVVNK